MKTLLMTSIIILAATGQAANAQANATKKPPENEKTQLKVNGESSWEAAYEKFRQAWLKQRGLK